MTIHPVIEGYEIRAVLEEHRLGVVYDAIRRHDGRSVHLLLIQPALQQILGFDQRLLAAAEKARKLGESVSDVVPVIDAGRRSGRLFLARAAVQAQGLDGVARIWRQEDVVLPADALPRLLSGAAKLLQPLHENDLIHANVTPAALRVVSGGALHLTDLGLPALTAEEVRRLSRRAAVILPFMPPEQMLGTELSPSSDVFALGAVAYFLAAGQLPRPLKEFKDGVRAYWAHTPQLLHDLRPDVAPRVSAIVHKAISVGSEHRFRNAMELVDALEDVVARLPGAAGAATPHERQPTSFTELSTAAVQPGDPVAESVGPDHAEIGRGEPADPPLHQLTAQMTPEHILQGQSVAVTLHNSGNQPLTAAVAAEDSEGPLRFSGERDEILLAAGETETVAVRVTADKEPLVGRAREVPFAIRVTTAEGLSETLHGTAGIEPIVPTWVAGIILLGLLGTCIGLGFLLGPLGLQEPSQPFAGGAAVLTPTPTATATATEPAVVAPAASLTPTATALPATATSTAVPTNPTPTATPAATETATVRPTATTAVAAEATAQAGAATLAATTEQTPPATSTPTPSAPPANEIAVHLLVDGDDQIWAVARDGSEQRLLLEDGSQPAWSPEGWRLAFTREVDTGEPGAEGLFVTNSDGAGLVPLYAEGLNIGGLSWSPDGRQLAFHAAEEGETTESSMQIFVVNSDGSDLTQVTTGAEGFSNMWPVWSPEGAQLLFFSVRQSAPDNGQLRLLSPGAASAIVLFGEGEGTAFAGEYDWSPDGSRVVFAAAEEGEPAQLYVVDLDDRQPEPLTPQGVAARMPDWSPSEDRILFVTGGEDTDEAVVTVDDEGDDEQIVAGGLPIDDVFWSPSGDEVAIVGDFNVDGLSQLFVFAADGSGLLGLLNDGSDITGLAGDLHVASADWRPSPP